MLIKIKDIIKKIESTIYEVTEDIMNGEEAINMEIYVNVNKNKITATFDMDCGRRGIDSYDDSYIEFKKGSVNMILGEMLEGGGIEEEVEELLLEYSNYLFDNINEIETDRVFTIEHDTNPMDMLDIVESIFSDLGVEYTKDESESITYSYKIK